MLINSALLHKEKLSITPKGRLIPVKLFETRIILSSIQKNNYPKLYYGYMHTYNTDLFQIQWKLGS